MKPMNRKDDTTIFEPSHPEIEPTFGIALIWGTFSIICCPDTVVVKTISMNFLHITWIKHAGK